MKNLLLYFAAFGILGCFGGADDTVSPPYDWKKDPSCSAIPTDFVWQDYGDINAKAIGNLPTDQNAKIDAIERHYACIGSKNGLKYFYDPIKIFDITQRTGTSVTGKQCRYVWLKMSKYPKAVGYRVYYQVGTGAWLSSDNGTTGVTYFYAEKDGMYFSSGGTINFKVDAIDEKGNVLSTSEHRAFVYDGVGC